MDKVKPMIENIEWLSAEDRKKIFEDFSSKGLLLLFLTGSSRSM